MDNDLETPPLATPPAPSGRLARISPFLRETRTTIFILVGITGVLFILWNVATTMHDTYQAPELTTIDTRWVPFVPYVPPVAAPNTSDPTSVSNKTIDSRLTQSNDYDDDDDQSLLAHAAESWLGFRQQNPPNDWPACWPIQQEPPRSQQRDQRRWVFCHMPKTGGMTMRGLLKRWATRDHQTVAHLNKNYNRPKTCGPGKCNGILGTQSQPQLREWFGDSDQHRPWLLTMLRDPIARSYSAYDYVLRESNKPIHPLYKANSLESLLKTKRFYNDIGLGANAYTRVLSDFLPDQAEACERRYKKHQGQWSDRLEGREYWDCRMDIAKRVLSQHMDLVCVTERYRDCIDVAATELFPTWFPKNYGRIPVRNAAPKPHRSKNSRVDALLRQANQQDLELYQYAWHLFECRWQQYTLRREKQAQLVAWGNNRHGQLGVAQPAWIYRLINVTLLETRTDAVPVQIGGGGGIWDWTAKNQRVCGAYSLVLTSRGTLFSAGWNRWALLGRQGKRGMQDDSPMFAPISFVDPATTTTTTTNNFSATVLQFSAGHRHALAVVAMVDRRELSNVLLYVYAWGMNGYGQLGTGTVGSSRPQRVRGLPDAKTDPVVRVAAGGRHSLALTRSGQVWAWGLNQGNLLFLDRTKTKRSSHGDHVYAPERVEPLRQVHVAEICAGTRHSMALDRQGGIWEWGWSAECPKDQMRLCKRAEFRKVELPLDASQPIDVVCAGGGSFALDAQGQLYAWGTNAVAELGLGHPNQVGEYVMDPIRVEGLPPLQRVWSSYDYVPGFHGGMTLALSRRGHPRLWAWGPLGPGVHASRIDVGTSAQRFDEKDARKWCQEHHDGHLGNQLERCALQLWRYIATNPVQLHQHLSSKDCLWTTAGVVNRGSVLYSVCAPLFGINTS